MTRLRIDETGLPMRLRRVRVTQDGTLLGTHDRSTQHFSFSWRGETFAGHYRHDADGARLRLAAEVAVLPYAGEDPTGYAALKAIVDAARDHLGPVVRIRRDRHVVIGRHLVLDPPMTADGLVSVLVRTLLAVDPYLRLIQQHRPGGA